MKQVILEEHYGVNVWTNKEMDELRKTECLCLNCNKGYCPAAHSMYETCKQYDLATMITRCPDYEARK